MKVGVQVRLDAMLRGLRWLGHALAEAAERRGAREKRRDGVAVRRQPARPEARR